MGEPVVCIAAADKTLKANKDAINVFLNFIFFILSRFMLISA